MKIRANPQVKAFLKRIGAKGGASRSVAKVKAGRTNIVIAQKARRKYPPCPNYKNGSHRFSPKTGKCYGCGYKRALPPA